MYNFWHSSTISPSIYELKIFYCIYSIYITWQFNSPKWRCDVHRPLNRISVPTVIFYSFCKEIFTSLTIIQFSLLASTTTFTLEIFPISSVNWTWAIPSLKSATTKSPLLATVKPMSCMPGVDSSSDSTSRDPFLRISSLCSGFPVLIKILGKKNPKNIGKYHTYSSKKLHVPVSYYGFCQPHSRLYIVPINLTKFDFVRFSQFKSLARNISDKDNLFPY